jgi:hypothetical protein
VTVSLVLACRPDAASKASTTGTSAAETDPKHRADLLQALSAVESSSGATRADARWKFFDMRTSLDLRPTPGDVDLLPRFEALLRSHDDADAELGVLLVAGVHHTSSLSGLWSIVNDSSRGSLLRGKAITLIASGYHDPKLVPKLREIISKNDPPPEAIRALGYYASDARVEQYLRQLLKDPKHVTLAAEALGQSHLSFDPKEAAVAQRRYSNWAEGISIDFPEDWPTSELDGYTVVFRNERLGAFYGYRVLSPKRASKAARLRDEIERDEHVHNELVPDRRAPAREAWASTMATDVAAGKYTLLREGREFVRRAVVLVRGPRGVMLAGEAPKTTADEFEAVFDRMWPTIHIGAADPEGAAAFTKTVDEGLERAKRGRLLPESR